jgi:hypothetical protein
VDYFGKKASTLRLDVFRRSKIQGSRYKIRSTPRTHSRGGLVSCIWVAVINAKS